MLPVGAFVNMAAILAGGGIGVLLRTRLPEKVRASIFQGLGLSVLVVGMRLALKTANPLIIIASIVCGGMVGGMLRLEDRIINGSVWVKTKLRSENPLFTDGLVVAVTIFCLGSLALLGPLDEGVRGDRALLYTKSILDGLTAMALASVYGAGVLCSALPVFLYEAALTMLASSLQHSILPPVVNELTAVGGVLTLGIAMNLLEIKHVPLPNMLPSLVFTVILARMFL